MKAITPVIALVMLMLITVGIVGASYAWFSGILSTQTKKSISIPAGGVYCASGDIKVYILNNGDSPITANDIVVADVDGVNVINTPFFGDLSNYFIAHWKFDEASGNAIDYSGKGNDGTLENNPERTAGKYKNGLKFAGVVNQRVVKDWADFTSTSLTIKFWMRPDVVSTGWRDIVGIRDDDGTRFHLDTVDNSITWYKVYDGGSIDSNVIPTAGKWYHVAGTHDSGTTAKVYINGELKNSATVPANILSGRLVAGNDGELYVGMIDEVKIYNKEIGDVNIQAQKSGLVIDYPAAEGNHIVRVGTSSNVAESKITCQ
ncbi:MAG: LamG domain-containing protein [Candidatus Aenigmarchaeota archaeon]|nr:LamG domain-containing protein [Candidatus Aenigmarchaeota archaeon]